MKALDAQVEVFAPKVGVARACAAFGVNARSYRHRRQRDEGRLRLPPPAEPRPRRAHPAALSDDEKDHIVATLCSERFCDLAPAQVYATLLDEGIYLCSERQMYRVLAERGLVRRVDATHWALTPAGVTFAREKFDTDDAAPPGYVAAGADTGTDTVTETEAVQP